MFSWTDYFDNDKVNIINNEKILEKSNSYKLLSQSVIPNGNRSKIRDCKSKLTSDKSSINRPNTFRNKPNCKILDLSPDEKEKIAKLIKELGQLQSEKEQISHKLCDERSQFQMKLQSFEEMHNLTLKEKTKLEEELQFKEERLIKLEKKIQCDMHAKESKYTDKKDPILSSSRKVHKTCSSSISDVPVHGFPGPPKSSRSQEIKQELIRAYSCHSDEHIRSEQHKQLTNEHERLLIEKQYLDVVLKQQKCLNHLKKKIRKLEKRESCENDSSYLQSQTVPDISSIRSPSTQSFTPKVLNEVCDDRSSISLSIGCTNNSCASDRLHDLIGYPDKICSTECAQSEFVLRSDSMILREEDLLMLSVLNEEPIKSDSQSSLPPPKCHPIIVPLKTHSPTDSLFEIISDLEDIDSNKCDFSLNGNFPIEKLSDKEIIDDLFFNRLFY